MLITGTIPYYPDSGQPVEEFVGMPVPLYNGHPRCGVPMPCCGEIIAAQVVEREDGFGAMLTIRVDDEALPGYVVESLRGERPGGFRVYSEYSDGRSRGAAAEIAADGDG